MTTVRDATRPKHEDVLERIASALERPAATAEREEVIVAGPTEPAVRLA